MYTGITECKRSEEAVQESERVHAFQSEILEAVQDPILAVGPDFKIVYWNDAAVRTFGWTADEVLGCHVTEVLKTTVPDSLREEILGQMFATGEYRGEAVYCRKDGHQVPMEVNSRVVRGADGKVLRVVTILRDITERRRIEQRLEILAEANALLLQSDDPEAVVQYIAEKVMANLQADVFFNYMLDSGEDRLRLNACGGVSKRTAKLIERLELGQAICGCVARDGERIISEDVQNNGDPRADLVRRMGVQCYVCHPLKVGNETIGTLSFGTKRTTCFSADEIELMRTVANQVSIAMERMRAEQAQRQAEQLAMRASLVSATLARVNEILLAARTVDDVLTRLVNDVSIEAGADRCLIIEVRGNMYTAARIRGVREDLIDQERSSSCFRAVALAVQERRPVLIDDAWTDPRTNKDFVHSYDLRAFELLPIIEGDRVTHVLALVFDSPQEFNELDAEAAERISVAMTVAMGNAKLYERERRARRVNEALSAIDQEIYSTLDRREVLVRVGPLAAEALGADGALLWVQDGDDWSVLYVHEAPGDLIGSAFPAAELPLITAAIKGGAPIAIEDVMIDARTNPFLRAKIGLKSVLLTPVFVAGRPVAVVFFVYRTQRSFSDEEVAWVSRLASSLGLAMANAELYQSERRIAETLQETLVVLPHRVPGVEFSHAYKAATHELGRVGGDFVDLFEVRCDFIGIVIGDVAGSGIDAAVITSLVRNTIRAYAIDGLSPSAAVEKSNNVMKRFTDLDAYVTLFFGMLSTRTGLFHYVSAGHPPALVLSSKAAIEELAGRNPIMGAFENTKFHEAQTVLAPGDRLVLYTDGVTEARAPDAGGFLGVGGFEQLLQIHTGQATRKLADTLMKDVVEFSKGVLRDDAAILVVEPTNFALPGEGHLRLALG